MTREEAIEVFTELNYAYKADEYGDYFYDHGDEVCQAASMAISALREQDVPARNVAKTNADHIRSMTDKELSKLLSKPWCENHRFPEECLRFDTDCEACVMDWLCKPGEVTHEQNQ